MNRIEIKKKEINLTFNVIIGSRVYRFDLKYINDRMSGKISNMSRLNKSLKPKSKLENVVDSTQMESTIQSLNLPPFPVELIEDLCRIYSEDEPLNPFRIVQYGDDSTSTYGILNEYLKVFFPDKSSYISFKY